jgi:hypothetical protein
VKDHAEQIFHDPVGIETTCWMLVATGGLFGCSSTEMSEAPIDCNIVKTQAAAGETEEQIAAT